MTEEKRREIEGENSVLSRAYREKIVEVKLLVIRTIFNSDYYISELYEKYMLSLIKVFCII
jgi:hypothetical protein